MRYLYCYVWTWYTMQFVLGYCFKNRWHYHFYIVQQTHRAVLFLLHVFQHIVATKILIHLTEEDDPEIVVYHLVVVNALHSGMLYALTDFVLVSIVHISRAIWYTVIYSVDIKGNALAKQLLK
jgi:hypothetical protein